MQDKHWYWLVVFWQVWHGYSHGVHTPVILLYRPEVTYVSDPAVPIEQLNVQLPLISHRPSIQIWQLV